ncbi:HNH endonuclease [bacterium]|nr:HNH endonuclease [bacterium]
MNLTISKANPNSITFNRRLALKHTEVKYLPKLNCACCGRDLITAPEAAEFYKKITKPLKLMMEKGFFKPWQSSTRVWNVLQSFSLNFPDMNLDTILDVKENQKALKIALVDDLNELIANGKREFKNERYFKYEITDEYADLLRRSRTHMKSASAVMRRLLPLKETFEGHKKAVFEQLEIYARKYPRKRLQEIINLDEVYRFHQQKDWLQRAQTREKLDFHFDNILLLVKKQNPQAVEFFEDLKLEAVDLLELEHDSAARIPKMKKMYEKALKEHGCEKLIPKVNKELEQVPISFITVDSFLVFAKNHKFSDGQIIMSLISPYTSSVEHIIPISEGGKDSIENIIVLCRECNRNRSSVPYTEFIQYHPMMSYHTQRQINQIGDYILNGTFDADKFLPIKVSKTLHNYTHGKISPDYSDYCKKQIRRSERKIKKRDTVMKEVKQAKVDALRQKADLEREIKGLDKKMNDISHLTQELNKDNDSDNNFINQMKKQIKK